MKIRISIFFLIFAVFSFGFQPARADWSAFVKGMNASFVNFRADIASSFEKLGFEYSYLTPVFAWTFGKKALGSLNRARLSKGFARKKGLLGFMANATICGWSLLEARKKLPEYGSVRQFFNDNVPSVQK